MTGNIKNNLEPEYSAKFYYDSIYGEPGNVLVIHANKQWLIGFINTVLNKKSRFRGYCIAPENFGFEFYCGLNNVANIGQENMELQIGEKEVNQLTTKFTAVAESEHGFDYFDLYDECEIVIRNVTNPKENLPPT
ncbi:MAG: hypothetical protein GY746_07745 [Gammaproteobacteria bacterium]|nr:hypothetical protein [Gammaproteobacteria bacterium]